MFVCGVDVGSTQTKAIIMDEGKKIIARALIPTGSNVVKVAERAFHEVLAKAELKPSDISYTVGTGYGRYKVTFGNTQITEISCHAKGSHFIFPNTVTVVDMGGQDTKAIKVGKNGEVLDFAMNDKCAAGTGRFLAASSEVMGCTLDELGPLSLSATNPVRLSSVCTVFVESDIMSYLAQGKQVEDIAGGVHTAIAVRTVALVRRVGIEEEVTFTGGVARNIGMVKALEEKLATRLNVSPESHYMGAIGAALFALVRARQGVSEKSP